MSSGWPRLKGGVFDAEPGGGAIERRAHDPPVEREGEGGAERAAVPVRLGEGDEGAALGGDRRFALRRAGGAGRAAGGDREPGQHPALVGHRVGRLAEPGAGGGLGRAQGGELDHAGVAAVQHAQEMDRVGDVAGAVRARPARTRDGRRCPRRRRRRRSALRRRRSRPPGPDVKPCSSSFGRPSSLLVVAWGSGTPAREGKAYTEQCKGGGLRGRWRRAGGGGRPRPWPLPGRSLG